ncbi:MAG: spermidine synthase [Arcobacter sp.]|nr:MAG: spermidine synthase [Arcobacter sp.]
MSKEFIYNEMMAHIPVCSHKAPTNLLLISNAPEGIEAELARHAGLNVTTGTLDAIAKGEDAAYDIVLIDSSADISRATYAHLNRIVKEDGLISTLNASLDDETTSKAQLSAIGEYFKVVMPYKAEDKTMILASKSYHPTADVILHRTDLIDGLSYYNCDIHVSCFAMPNYIRKNYRGIIKN